MEISGRTQAPRRPLSIKRDAVFVPALFLFNCFSFSAWTQLAQVETKPWLVLVWLCGLVGLVPLAWRDRAPLTVFATQCLLAVATWPILPYYTPLVGIPVALYAVSVHYSREISLLALLISFIPNGVGAGVSFRLYNTPTDQIRAFAQNAVFLVLVAGGAWASGRLTQASQRHVQHLEREKKTTQEAVAEERRRIARELHDIVSHAVTVIVLQAAGAARVAETDFAEVIQSLANIETMGKQTMAELQRLLGVLDDSYPADDGLGPQPGLANLADLLASFRAAGRRVTDHVKGTPRDLDPSVDLAAYRIVQEGLTNVLKHAGEHANPQLRLDWEAHSLLIQIDNGINLTKANPGQVIFGGRGLVGLRERAHAVGGHLQAGPRGDGYRLTATLPVATPATHPGVPSIPVPRASGRGRGD